MSNTTVDVSEEAPGVARGRPSNKDVRSIVVELAIFQRGVCCHFSDVE